VFDAIPLPIRMFFYSISFLALMLAGLPWLAYRLDVFVPSWHVEIGWYRLIGVVVFAIAFSIYLYASFVLTRIGRGAYVEFDPPKEFVAVGPFRWCRNPIAGTLVLTVLGEAIALSSTGILLWVLVGIPLAHIQVVFLEEPLLRKRFGQAYIDYVNRVPRWIPRVPEKRSA